jgi:hypothetical protein
VLFLVSTFNVALDPTIADVLIELSGFLAVFAGAAFLTGLATFLAGAFLVTFLVAFLATFLVGDFGVDFFATGFDGLAAVFFPALLAALLASFLAIFLRAMRGETLICISSLRQLGARLGGQLEFANDRLPRNSGLD